MSVSARHVKLTVYCANGHVVGEYIDSIEEKYPFFCQQCPNGYEDLREGRYPWRLISEIVDPS